MKKEQTKIPTGKVKRASKIITTGAKVILGKNSTREPNEAQALLRIPAARHTDDWVKCTYLHIPQVSRTFEVLLSLNKLFGFIYKLFSYNIKIYFLFIKN